KFTYDQNHAYIPTIGMTTAALALLGEVPEADEWVRRGYAVMRRCRYALGDDGYYYEGLGYWSYALHWHVRYAELMGRATGRNLFDLPALRENWRFALYLSLPGAPNGFDVGDTGIWSGTEIPELRLGNVGMYWAVAAATKSSASRLVGDMLSKRWPSTDYPASAFLWYSDAVAPADLDKLPTWHYFTDQGVVSWRSGWSDDDTAALFRVGPPLGHQAAKKLGEMTDWATNCGHVHPDIGSVWLYAHRQYMASDTGYLAEKYTRDHNTLLVDGKGQGVDGSYHNEQGYPYERFNKARLDRVRFTDKYGYATGEFGSVYGATPEVSLRRTVVVTRDWLLTVDRLRDDEPHTLTWTVHAVAPFQQRQDAAGWIADYGESRMAVVPLDATGMVSEADKSIVQAGTGPGKPVPTHRGYHLRRTTAAPAKEVLLAHLMLPLAKDAAPPKVRPVELTPSRLVFELEPPEGKPHRVTILLPSDGADAQAGEGEPVTVEVPEK
ncbi:MAG: heparinase II/III family protein, partial [Planctomycetes bacterium]|nr:heparinase II/III family protein [Planctomycetota bacterium]